MCPLKKCCVSFALALLLSSVSLVPCFASDKVTGSDIIVNTDDTLCTVQGFLTIVGNFCDFPIPVNELMIFDTGYDTISVGFPIVPSFRNVSSFILQDDVTLYWSVVPFLYGNEGIDNADLANLNNMNTYYPKFYYGSGDAENEGYVTVLSTGTGNYPGRTSRSYRSTVPAVTPHNNFTECFRIDYPGFDEDDPNGNHAHWNTGGVSGASLMMQVDLFQVVHTTDEPVLRVLDRILSEAQSMNVNLNNILSALDDIIVELTDIGLGVDGIVEALELVNTRLLSMETILSSIDENVAAIYYFITESLVMESEEVSEATKNALNNVNYVSDQEDFFYTLADNGFDTVIDYFYYGVNTHANSIALVGNVFGFLWNALGSFQYLFMFSLFAGVLSISLRRARF